MRRILVRFVSLTGAQRSPVLAEIGYLLDTLLPIAVYALIAGIVVLLCGLPGPATSPRPTVILIHGGGGILSTDLGGATAELHRRLIADGYPVILATYRLAPAALWPAQVDDVLKLTKAVTKKNRQPLVLVGTSIGGTIAEMVAARTPVRAVVSLAAPQAWIDLPEIVPSGFRDSWFRVLGTRRGVDEPLRLTYELRAVPILLIHGSDDRCVPVAHAFMMRGALHDAGNCDMQCVIAHGEDHPTASMVARVYPTVRDWLAQH